MTDRPWWKDAVVYQIYPRSFADSNGDGIGDLEGIRRRLDHLHWLGVDAIWISPFFRSPMADFGYDVSDYCDVDPIFGAMRDFDALVADAHARNIKVVIDWVPNHSSDQHPWFVESRASRGSAKRDWYVWRDPAPDGGPPNNWIGAFLEGSAWTLDGTTGQYYLHLFLPEQPDLNWRNPAVIEAMHSTLRFWLDRGVDGFRMDVIMGIVKRADFADVGGGLVQMADESRYDPPAVHERLRSIRALLDDYPGDRVSIGEVFILSTARVAEYYGNDDELHLAFNFPPLFAPWDAAKWRHRIERTEGALRPRGAWPTWVLSNHDNTRHRTRYGGSEARARAAAVLLLTMRGTPFLFEGEELGLEDAVVPPERVVDPGGRDGCRAPVPWTTAVSHGWDGHEPWLPFPPEAGERSVEALTADNGSILHLYRRLLASRRASPALRCGDLTLLDAPGGVLAYERVEDQDHRIVLVNFTGESQAVAQRGTVEVSSIDPTANATRTFAGELRPDEAVILA
ncbi:MAG TPA: alpha-amylase family glycosyl hydrolase [Acidimicrobiales bacterium]|nr:alpha-amylase family glycosyl hydrolase [Acidimicrobiales bacterium]